MNVELNEPAVITGQQLFADRFWVRLPALQSTVLQFGTAVQGASLIYQQTIAENRFANEFTVTAQLRIDALTQDIFLDMQNSGGAIPFEVCVLREGTSGSNGSSDCLTTVVTQEAVRRFDAICDNPTLTGLSGMFKSVDASFSFPARPAIVTDNGRCFGGGTTNQDFVPTEAYVLLVNDSLGIDTLPAKTYTGEPVDPVTTCGLAPASGGGGACVTCAQDVYLDIEKIMESPEVERGDIRVERVETTEFSVAFAGLDEGSYTAFASYAFGLKVSSCFSGVPGNDLNAFELLGDTDTELGGEGFVATVAYGSSEHKDLDDLRWFRDSVLVRSSAGRSLVGYYYRYGPHAARWLDSKPVLKSMVRAGLVPVVYGVRALKWIRD